MSEWTNDRAEQLTNERINERMGLTKRTNSERTNERTNEKTSARTNIQCTMYERSNLRAYECTDKRKNTVNPWLHTTSHHPSPRQCLDIIIQSVFVFFSCNNITYGSGVYMGVEPWRMYWVAWNTRNARPARKSRDDSRPATGRRLNPEHSEEE